MAQWYMENYKTITVIAAVLCLVALYFAIRSTRRHNRTYRAEEAKLMRMKALKETFTELNTDIITNAEAADLLEGTALHYQLRIQKESNIEKAYELIPVCAQYVYVLDIFSSEGGVPSEFYQKNGNILRERFVPALEAIGETKLANAVKPLSRMYDPDDETASINNDLIASADEIFAQHYKIDEFKLKAAEYIRSNAELFI